MKTISLYLFMALFSAATMAVESKNKGLSCSDAFNSLMDQVEQVSYFEQMINEVMESLDKLKLAVSGENIKNDPYLNELAESYWQANENYAGDFSYAATMELLKMDMEGDGRYLYERMHEQDIVEVKEILKAKIEDISTARTNIASQASKDLKLRNFLKLQREVQKTKLELELEKAALASSCIRPKKLDKCLKVDLESLEAQLIHEVVQNSHAAFDSYLFQRGDLKFDSLFLDLNKNLENLPKNAASNYSKFNRKCLNKNTRLSAEFLMSSHSQIDTKNILSTAEFAEKGEGIEKNSNSITFVSRIIF